MTRPLIPALLTCLAGLVAAAPAAAHPALQGLVPLVEVYDARLASRPEFDVAGIRCGGLFTAQQVWSERHGGQGRPSRAQIADIELNLTRAEIARQQRGLGLSRAFTSTREDVLRVIDLYTTRFRSRDSGEGLPWQGDGLITSDTAFCDIMNGRR